MTSASIWVSLLFAATALALIFIRPREASRLLPFGIVGGALVYYLVSLAAVPLLRLWSFAPGVTKLTGIPLSSVLACIPAAMLFQKYIEGARDRLAQVAVVAAGTLAFTLLDWSALRLSALQYDHWSLMSTVGLSGLVLSALAYYVDETRILDADTSD